MSIFTKSVPYLKLSEQNIVPVSPLDNFLIPKNFENYKITFYNILTGEPLCSREQIQSFYKEITKLVEEGKYLTTDHLIYSIEIDSIIYLYVSLDNSVRSNQNGFSLAHTRLENLMRVVKKIIYNQNYMFVVYFSESCRPSFVGDVKERRDEISWITMRQTINQITGLEFLTEKRNNDDFSGLSFGLSVWITPNMYDTIFNYYSTSLLNLGFGSVAVGVRTKNNNIVWGIHFPLDFKNTGLENHGAITMNSLIELMNQYHGSVCAFGDMNTIPGNICNSIKEVVEKSGKYKLVCNDVYTFFGSFYDTIPVLTITQNEELSPVQLLDLPDEDKFKILQIQNK